MKLIHSLLLIFLASGGYAQFHKTPRSFVIHLLNQKLYDEAILVMQEKLQYATDTRERDSLYLAIGKTFYSLQQIPTSAIWLNQVSNAQPALHAEATLFSAFGSAHMHQYDKATTLLTAVPQGDSSWTRLRDLQLAGLLLLQHRFGDFDALPLASVNTWAITQQQAANLIRYRSQLGTVDRKSPALGAVLSALVPGAGKFYAGRKGNGLYSFLITSLLGAQTYEAYRKDGLNSARFIIYGTLFTSFYIGNVWGSAVAVKMVQTEKRDAIHSQILFDMHIPLRTFFR